jgi:hypothetical protein
LVDVRIPFLKRPPKHRQQVLPNGFELLGKLGIYHIATIYLHQHVSNFYYTQPHSGKSYAGAVIGET